jgi:hypothetical protein
MFEKCKKCGNRHIGTKYDGSLDVLRKTCGNCGYGWNEPPLDRKRADTMDKLFPSAGKIRGEFIERVTAMTLESAICELLVCVDNGCPYSDDCPNGCRAVEQCRESIRADIPAAECICPSCGLRHGGVALTDPSF